MYPLSNANILGTMTQKKTSDFVAPRHEKVFFDKWIDRNVFALLQFLSAKTVICAHVKHISTLKNDLECYLC